LNDEPVVVGVVLAAGRSSRFGGSQSKLMLDWQGEPLLRHTLRTATASLLSRVVLVLGCSADELRETASGLNVEIVVNPRYDEGQSTSIQAGLREAATANAAMFIPADQPFLTTGLIDRLVREYRASRAPVVLPVAGTRRGAPVVWDRTLFSELAVLEGDVGGRSVFHRYDLREVAAHWLELDDVDTAEDLRRLQSVKYPHIEK
jgi:molybdenum cofactor cytidylyltransferase